MPGDGGVADLAGQRACRGSGPVPCAGRRRSVPSTKTLSTPIFGIRMIATGLALGGDGGAASGASVVVVVAARPARSWSAVVVGAGSRARALLELALEVVLGPGR